MESLGGLRTQDWAIFLSPGLTSLGVQDTCFSYSTPRVKLQRAKQSSLPFSPLPPAPILACQITAVPSPPQVTNILSLSPASLKPAQRMVPAASPLAKGLGNSTGQCPKELGEGQPQGANWGPSVCTDTLFSRRGVGLPQGRIF